MQWLPDRQAIEKYLSQIRAWFDETVFDPSTLAQAGAAIVAFLIALALAPLVGRWLGRLVRRTGIADRYAGTIALFETLGLPLVWLLTQWITVEVTRGLDYRCWLLNSILSLLAAWVVIRFASHLIRDQAWSRFIAVIAWTLAALSILGLLQPAIEALDSIAVTLGEVRISAFGILKGLATLAVLLWAASFLSAVLEKRIQTMPTLTPSLQVLFGKLLKIVLITVAVVGGLSAVGVDLTALTVFGGAIGLGLGFGLQKVVSNLVSGVILLLDKSVKPGDVIAVAGTYGWINSLGARYVSVVTRDGVEHLIPNEELITTRVENWSYSNELVRLRTSVGISYKSDVRKAMALCLEAAQSVERVLKDPKPIVLLTGFGDSSVDLEVRFWIKDPQNGRGNVTSEILLAIWDRFHEHGIEIPFPQRDLHIRSAVPVPVETGTGNTA